MSAHYLVVAAFSRVGTTLVVFCPLPQILSLALSVAGDDIYPSGIINCSHVLFCCWWSNQFCQFWRPSASTQLLPVSAKLESVLVTMTFYHYHYPVFYLDSLFSVILLPTV